MFYRIRTAILMLALISAAALIAAALMGKETLEDKAGDSVYAAVGSSGGDERVSLFFKEGGAYFFLPSFADGARLALDENSPAVVIDGREYKDGDELPPAGFDGSITVGGSSYELHIMKSENLPAIFITTEREDTELIDADKGNFDEGFYRGINEDGSIDHSGGIEVIRARGNSSFQADKKSYRIRLSEASEIFGMSPAKSWILQANAYDNTNIRNTLAYTMAGDFDLPYTPEFRGADLYLNGEYNGSYLIMEPVRVGAGKVDIAGDDSYLFEVIHDEKRLDETLFSFMCGGEVHMQLLYPKPASKGQESYAADHMNRLDGMIEELAPYDSLDELSGYLDIGSFVNMYIFNFVTNDIDAGNYSTYYFIDGRDHLLHAGPVWDYDKAWGNEYKKNGLSDFNAYSYRWPEILSDNEEFAELVKKRYGELKGGVEYMLRDGIDEMARAARGSHAMDAIRYGNLSSQSVNLGSYEADVEQLKTYFGERNELLKGILNGEPYVKVFIKGRSGRLFWVKRGEGLGEQRLDFLRKLYGCDEFYESDSVVDEGTAFDEDTVIIPGYQ